MLHCLTKPLKYLPAAHLVFGLFVRTRINEKLHISRTAFFADINEGCVAVLFQSIQGKRTVKKAEIDGIKKPKYNYKKSIVSFI